MFCNLQVAQANDRTNPVVKINEDVCAEGVKGTRK